MLIGELEYDDMVQDSENHIRGSITGTMKAGPGGPFLYNGTLDNVTIEEEFVGLPFPVTDHLFIFTFVFFMSIIMINLLFGLAVSDVQVICK